MVLTGRFKRDRAVLLGIILVALIFRLAWADRIPGINGDEADVAYQIRAWMDGLDSNWITPTGRFFSPFLVAMIIPIQKIFGPTFFALRLPAMLSGFIEVVLAFWLLPKALGQRIGVLLALLMCCMPGYIVQSRLIWDLSHAGIISILSVYCIWKRNLLGALLTLAAAVIIHKVNIFITPMILIPFAWDWLENGRARTGVKISALCAMGVAGAIIAYLLSRNIPSEYGDLTHTAVLRAVMPWKFIPFFIHVVRLVTGVEFFPAPAHIAWLILLDAAGMGLAFYLLWAGTKSLLKKKTDPEARRTLSIVAAWAASVVAIYLVAGEYGIAGGHIFYVLGLGVPTLWVFLLLAQEVLDNEEKLISRSEMAASVFLAITAGFYFFPLLTSADGTDRMYLTSAQEPKQTAYEWIRSDFKARSANRRDPSPAQLEIIADDWWAYWPTVYLDSAYSNRAKVYHYELIVPRGLDERNVVTSENQLKEIFSRGGYAISIKGGLVDDLIARTYPSTDVLIRKEIPGFSLPGTPERTVVSVWRLKSSGF
ncbi:MAG: hypothetical protein P4M08_14665 [Oligoflexia bacterium]|nr:hypothetical protein [Oligoflexia bacterium]